MFNENHIIWFYIASQCVPPQHVEYSRLHNCHDRVKWKQTKGQNSHLLSSSLFSSLLAVLQIEGINVKSLRAFRVLRPLRLLSSIPSKSRKFKLLQKMIIDGNSLKFTKSIDYRSSRSLFVYIIFQASSGREMDHNKGLRLLL